MVADGYSRSDAKDLKESLFVALNRSAYRRALASNMNVLKITERKYKAEDIENIFTF